MDTLYNDFTIKDKIEVVALGLHKKLAMYLLLAYQLKYISQCAVFVFVKR